VKGVEDLGVLHNTFLLKHVGIKDSILTYKIKNLPFIKIQMKQLSKFVG